MEEIR
jgi:hypothetical protein